MDRKNFYAGQPVTEAELDAAFDDCENGINAVPAALNILGVVTGLVPTPPASGMSVNVSAGKAFDLSGNLVDVPSNANVSISTATGGGSTAVVGGGNQRIVSLFLKFARSTSDSRVDGNGTVVQYVNDESFTWVVRVGAESSGQAVPPALESDGVLICDIIMTFGMTNVTAAKIGTLRRQAYAPANPSQWLSWEPVSLANYGLTGVGTTLMAVTSGGSNNRLATRRYVVTTDTGKILTSSDGRVWATTYTGIGTTHATTKHAFWSNVAQKFIVGGSPLNATRIVTSPDGTTWTVRTDPSGAADGGICFAENASLVVLGRGGGNFITSPDGITWTARTNPAADKVIVALAWNGTQFVAFTLTGTRLTSPDGITWTDRGNANAVPSTAARGLVWTGTQWVATGGTSGNGTVETSADGITWTLRPASVDLEGGAAEVQETVMIGNAIYGVGQARNVLFKSLDEGITWDLQYLTAGFGNGIAAVNGALVAAGAINSLPGLLLGQRSRTR